MIDFDKFDYKRFFEDVMTVDVSAIEPLSEEEQKLEDEFFDRLLYNKYIKTRKENIAMNDKENSILELEELENVAGGRHWGEENNKSSISKEKKQELSSFLSQESKEIEPKYKFSELLEKYKTQRHL